MDLGGSHRLFVSVPRTPRPVKGLGMIDWARRIAAARMSEDPIVPAGRGQPMPSGSRPPAHLSPFLNGSASQPAQVSGAHGGGMGNGVIPTLPLGILLLRAAPCFVRALLICCLCAVGAGTEWQQNYGYRSNSIKTTPLAAHIHPVEFNIALRLAISFSPVVCFWI